MHVMQHAGHSILGDFQLARLATDLRKNPATREQAAAVDEILAHRQRERQAERDRGKQKEK